MAQTDKYRQRAKGPVKKQSTETKTEGAQKMIEMKFMEAVLHTAGITVEQLLADQYGNFGEMTYNDIQNWLKACKEADGAKVLVTVDKRSDGKNEYTLMSWDKDSDEKMKMFYYYCEQDSMFGCYQDDFEQFCDDWDRHEYEPDGCMVFQQENVEIIKAENATPEECS